MDEKVLFHTTKVSEDNAFLTLTGYDELFIYQPFPLDPDVSNDEHIGTYITRIEKGNNVVTYRVYHYRLFNGIKGWFKLPSINLIDGNYLTESSTIVALAGLLTEDKARECGLEDLFNKLLNNN